MKGTWAAGILAAAVLLTGCGGGLPRAREMGEMALMRTMGVDGNGEGTLAVTVSTGKRAVGTQGGTAAPLILYAESPSLSGACREIQGLSSYHVFYGYVDQILLGESMALQGVEPVLEYLSRDVELGLGAQIWLVRDGSAQSAIESGGESGVEEQLSILRKSRELGVGGLTRTAEEVFQDILEQGGTYLPALHCVPSEQEGEASLLEWGYGVLREDRLVGYLEGDGARGLELLAGQGNGDLLEVELSGGLAVVEIGQTTTQFIPVYQQRELKEIHLVCQVNGALTEFPSPMEGEEVNRLRELVEQQETQKIQRALDQLRSWRVDCVGIGHQLSMAAPEGWRWIEEDWERLFVNVPITVTVQATINRTYGDLG